MANARLPGASFPPPRRVFTAPVSAPVPKSTPATRSGDGLVETLFNHPAAKIVAFTAGNRPLPASSGWGLASLPEIEPGTLSWSSQLERTIAVGPFRIYRAPGSVAFLNCGTALQPILPKSQCWCVDERSSKFVLQIRRPQYWRIEIPMVDDEDVRRAQLLREVLDSVLQFEKTECPFKRTFTVELPERPRTPVKKRPWTPVRRPCVSLPPTPVTPLESRTLRKSRNEKRVQANEELSEPVAERFVETKTKAEQTPTELPLVAPEDHVEAVQSEPAPEPEQQLDVEPNSIPRIPPARTRASSLEETASRNSSRAQAGGFQASRSVTAPPQLMLATHSLKSIGKEALESTPSDDYGLRSESPTPSQESFHSVLSWHSPIPSLPPSPPLSDPESPIAFPYPHDNIMRPCGKFASQRDASELSPAPDTPQTWRRVCSTGPATPLALVTPIRPSPTKDCDMSSTGTVATAEEQPIASSPQSEAEAASTNTARDPPATNTGVTRRPQIRHRATTSSSISPNRRALSPLPPAANLFTPRQPASLITRNKLAVVRQLPMAVIHKTCEILLSPPSHLINLMLKVAARITAGEWRGFVFGTSDSGERIPVHWDWSDGDDDGEGELDGWGADDDWPHHSFGKRMAGSFPDDDDSSCSQWLDEAESKRSSARRLSDADWSQNWEVD